MTLITTHAHSDHMGSAHKWKELGVPILAPKEINNWYSGYWGSFMKRVDTSLGRYVYSISNNINYPGLHALSELLFTSKLFHYPKYLDADFLDISLFNNKKTIISNDFLDWEAILVPGHTSHMISLYNYNKKIFYASDALVVLNKELKFPIPVDFPMLQSDSINYIQNLDIKHLLTAHGGYVKIYNENELDYNLDIPVDLYMEKVELLNSLEKLKKNNKNKNYNLRKKFIELLFFPHFFNKEIRKVKEFISKID